MRISDWSSDVCSSDLADPVAPAPLALTMGEPAGIGGEIALQAWLRRDREHLPPFFLLDDPARLEAIAARFGWQVPLRQIASPAETASSFATALPLLPVPLAAPARPGHPDTANVPTSLTATQPAGAFALMSRHPPVVTNTSHTTGR